MKRIIIAAIATVTPLAAQAHDGVHISDAYIISSNRTSAAAFMEIENTTGGVCTLTGVSSDAAARVELHTSVESDGVMRMVRLEDGIAIQPNSNEELERGGNHVMVMGLSNPLQDGDVVPMTFDFGDCGTEQADITVNNQGDDADSDDAAAEPADHTGH